MKMTSTMLVLGFVLAAGCKSDKKTETGEAAGGKASSGLEMSSSSAACKKAMSCCEKMVAIQKGKATIEDINLSCSGVALAKTDGDCDLFRQGYAAALEGKEVPADCK